MKVDAKPLFPFSALLGQEHLRRALLLAAIDPGIGGVLIEGPRGTAKSTSARAMAQLLPDGQLVTLPLGASEEQLIGSLDIEAALQGAKVRFAPGLLARADGGVLYVDEVNLLPDALVDQLLDVAASGVNVIERDGISHSHDASFVLIGTMNREEGELRPQLLDRFGLALRLETCRDPALRQAIVKSRLAFDAAPALFCDQFAAAQKQLIERIQRGRANLASITWGDEIFAHVTALCIEAAVDGVRADLVILRAARALAALEEADTVRIAHVDAIAELALYHRRQNAPRAQAPASKLPAPTHPNQSDPASESPESQDADNPWGELAPQPVAPQPVKGVRPFTPKKY